jgi:hypothetical protein
LLEIAERLIASEEGKTGKRRLNAGYLRVGCRGGFGSRKGD